MFNTVACYKFKNRQSIIVCGNVQQSIFFIQIRTSLKPNLFGYYFEV